MFVLSDSDPMECSPPGSSVVEFSRHEYWSGQPFLFSGDLPSAGIEPVFYTEGRFFTVWLCFLKYQRHSDGNRFVQVAATPDGVQGSIDSQRPAAFPGQLIEHLQKKKKVY